MGIWSIWCSTVEHKDTSWPGLLPSAYNFIVQQIYLLDTMISATWEFKALNSVSFLLFSLENNISFKHYGMYLFLRQLNHNWN